MVTASTGQSLSLRLQKGRQIYYDFSLSSCQIGLEEWFNLYFHGCDQQQPAFLRCLREMRACAPQLGQKDREPFPEREIGMGGGGQGSGQQSPKVYGAFAKLRGPQTK